MDNLEKGIELETLYKKKLMESLMRNGIPEENSENLSYDLVHRQGNDLGGRELVPAYENLLNDDIIPIDDQRDIMIDRIKNPEPMYPSREETEEQRSLRNMFPLYKGQGLG